jgi:hypothetical protein
LAFTAGGDWLTGPDRLGLASSGRAGTAAFYFRLDCFNVKLLDPGSGKEIAEIGHLQTEFLQEGADFLAQLSPIGAHGNARAKGDQAGENNVASGHGARIGGSSAAWQS